LYPDDLSRLGDIYNRLMGELVDKSTGKLEQRFKDKYNKLSLQFKVGQYEPSSLVALQGCYKEMHNYMHGSNRIDIPERTGLSCGGKSRQQQHKHVFIVAVIQMLCAERGRSLDPTLQNLLVLTEDFGGVHGTVAKCQLQAHLSSQQRRRDGVRLRGRKKADSVNFKLKSCQWLVIRRVPRRTDAARVRGRTH
jgi:hypothetical protein